jgi:hypothetical protein
MQLLQQRVNVQPTQQIADEESEPEEVGVALELVENDNSGDVVEDIVYIRDVDQ